MGATSQHFTDAELACKHCGKNLCTSELVLALEALRTVINKPIKINDAYRCPTHNAEVGGAPNSEHLQGTAADVRVDGMSAAALEAAVELVPSIRGIGRADHQDYVHIDVRLIPHKWCYNVDGQWVGYYPPKVVDV